MLNGENVPPIVGGCVSGGSTVNETTVSVELPTLSVTRPITECVPGGSVNVGEALLPGATIAVVPR